ncbi:MAG: hypothetical protein IKI64_08820 [Clostridia bacterium]|nr:hypothetical protein [Clostridia bacterium]
MKKTILYLIFALIAALSLTGCKKTEPAIENRLSPQEIMALPKVQGEGAQRSFYSSFTEPYALDEKLGHAPALISAEVLSVKYYIEWNRETEREDRYAVYEIKITGVQEEYNALGVKVGDIKHVIQDSHIDFTLAEDWFAFLSEKTGIKIKDRDSRKEAESGVFELVPQKGVEYEYYVNELECPMQVGESYTMYIMNSFHDPVEGNSLCGCIYACPMNSGKSLAEYAKEHGLRLPSDIIAISEEIAAMFD